MIRDLDLLVDLAQLTVLQMGCWLAIPVLLVAYRFGFSLRRKPFRHPLYGYGVDHDPTGR